MMTLAYANLELISTKMTAHSKCLLCGDEPKYYENDQGFIVGCFNQDHTMRVDNVDEYSPLCGIYKDNLEDAYKSWEEWNKLYLEVIDE